MSIIYDPIEPDQNRGYVNEQLIQDKPKTNKNSEINLN